jgi:hypothetical protein
MSSMAVKRSRERGVSIVREAPLMRGFIKERRMSTIMAQQQQQH